MHSQHALCLLITANLCTLCSQAPEFEFCAQLTTNFQVSWTVNASKNIGRFQLCSSIAIKAAMIMCSLLLQRSHQSAKTGDFIASLEHCLDLWGKDEVGIFVECVIKLVP